MAQPLPPARDDAAGSGDAAAATRVSRRCAELPALRGCVIERAMRAARYYAAAAALMSLMLRALPRCGKGSGAMRRYARRRAYTVFAPMAFAADTRRQRRFTPRCGAARAPRSDVARYPLQRKSRRFIAPPCRIDTPPLIEAPRSRRMPVRLRRRRHARRQHGCRCRRCRRSRSRRALFFDASITVMPILSTMPVVAGSCRALMSRRTCRAPSRR